MDEPVVILCPTCGAECTSDATFCGTCGSALEQAATSAPDRATTFVAEPAPIEAEASTIPEIAPVPEPLAPPAVAPVAAMAAP
ncbi:MAG TPA: hypothetical protein VGR57_03800, partial [Ktedonobacterales bacterium]|nr:hypothetical protein [Ktedonobacterales bacterium]